MIFLTIDDVPSTVFAEKLAWLQQNQVPALLFIWGEKAAGYESLLIDAIRHGFRLGNHSWTHRHFSKLTQPEISAEVMQSHGLLQSLHDQAGIPWERKRFRFPYLDAGRSDGQTEWIQDFLREAGYEAPRYQAGERYDTLCTFDQKDYYLNNPDAPDGLDKSEAILGRITPASPAPMDIVLIHDHDYSHKLFFRCIERYIQFGATFGLS